MKTLLKLLQVVPIERGQLCIGGVRLNLYTYVVFSSCLLMASTSIDTDDIIFHGFTTSIHWNFTIACSNTLRVMDERNPASPKLTAKLVECREVAV